MILSLAVLTLLPAVLAQSATVTQGFTTVLVSRAVDAASQTAASPATTSGPASHTTFLDPLWHMTMTQKILTIICAALGVILLITLIVWLFRRHPAHPAPLITPRPSLSEKRQPVIRTSSLSNAPPYSTRASLTSLGTALNTPPPALGTPKQQQHQEALDKLEGKSDAGSVSTNSSLRTWRDWFRRESSRPSSLVGGSFDERATTVPNRGTAQERMEMRRKSYRNWTELDLN